MRKLSQKVLGTITFAAASFFAAVIAILHFLKPDQDPLSRPTSEYAVGEYGWLMISAFIVLSLGSFALIAGLSTSISEPAKSKLGLAFLAIWALGLLVAAAFPIDVEGAPQTLHGTVHRINGPIVFLSLTLGVLLTSRSFNRDDRWRPVYRFAFTLAVILLASFFISGALVASGSGFGGLGQRFFLVILVTWYFATAARLRSLSPS